METSVSRKNKRGRKKFETVPPEDVVLDSKTRRRSSQAQVERDTDEQPVTSSDHGWDCSACTYHNIASAFKCSICDTRKGTSTRKPRLSTVVVEQQATVEKFVHAQQAAAIAQAKVKKRVPCDRDTGRESPCDVPSPSPPLQNNGPSSSRNTTPSSLTPSGTPAPKSPSSNRSAACKVPKRPRRLDRSNTHPRFNDIDINSARTLTVTVNNLTVVITDYKMCNNNASAASSTSAATDQVVNGCTTSSTALCPPQ